MQFLIGLAFSAGFGVFFARSSMRHQRRRIMQTGAKLVASHRLVDNASTKAAVLRYLESTIRGGAIGLGVCVSIGYTLYWLPLLLDKHSPAIDAPGAFAATFTYFLWWWIAFSVGNALASAHAFRRETETSIRRASLAPRDVQRYVAPVVTHVTIVLAAAAIAVGVWVATHQHLLVKVRVGVWTAIGTAAFSICVLLPLGRALARIPMRVVDPADDATQEAIRQISVRCVACAALALALLSLEIVIGVLLDVRFDGGPNVYLAIVGASSLIMLGAEPNRTVPNRFRRFFPPVSEPVA